MFGLSVSYSRNIFILKSALFRCLQMPYLHWKLCFQAHWNMHNYKLYCLSSSIIVALHVMLKRKNFYHITFHDTTLKSWFEPCMAVALVCYQVIFDNISLVRIGPWFMDDCQECRRWCWQYRLLDMQIFFSL